MSDTLLSSVVAYDPKVVTIWDGFKQWVAACGLDVDDIRNVSSGSD